MKILFLGSSRFSKIVLEELLQSSYEVVAVICQPDRPAGRGHKLLPPEIKEYALENGLNVLQYDRVNDNIEEIFSLDFDVFVTASFGQILSREFLSRKLGLNVHPSKLPKYRGATPLQTALLNGDKETGVSVQKMEYEVDSGDILMYEDIKIAEEDNFISLEEKTAKLGGRLLVDGLNKIQNGQARFVRQSGDVTYTKMIKKEDGLLEFSKSAHEIVNKIRALGENPGCYFYIENDRIKVKKASICTDFEAKAGEILLKNKRFFIGTRDTIVEILLCQAQNGKMLSARDFINGYKFKSDRVN